MLNDDCDTAAAQVLVGPVLAVVLAALTVVGGISGYARATACPDTDIGSVAPAADGLQVEKSAVSALRSGDVLVQLNNHPLQSCEDLAVALGEVRNQQLAPLFLIRRAGKTEVALVALPAAVAQPLAAAPPPPSLPSPIPTTAPTPSRQGDVEAARALLATLVAFGRDLEGRQPLPMAQPWVRRIEGLREQYDKQRVRGSSIGVVAPVLAYYETVGEILLYKAAVRERREVRARAEVVLPYHSGSVVSEWLQRYPFLGPSVIAQPEKTVLALEGNGLWAPDRAVALLVERALAEGSALSETLSAG